MSWLMEPLISSQMNMATDFNKLGYASTNGRKKQWAEDEKMSLRVLQLTQCLKIAQTILIILKSIEALKVKEEFDLYKMQIPKKSND